MNSAFLTIWFRPRSTLRQILETNSRQYVIPLALLMGITNALDRATNGRAGSNSDTALILFISLLAGPIGGLFSLYIAGGLLTWSGGLLGGTAEQDEVRAAIAWSSVIRSTAVLLLIPQILVAGGEIFKSETPLLDARMAADPQFALWGSLVMLAVIGIAVVIGIWYVMVFLKCLGEAHQFSAWKALFATIIGFGVVIVPIVLLVLLTTSMT